MTHPRIGGSTNSGLPGTMSLRAEAGNPYGTRDVTLSVQFDWNRQFVLGEQQKTERIYNLDETVSLTEGEAIVAPVKIESPEKILVLTVEPRIIRASALDPAAMESFEVGTETDVSCPGHTSLADALKGVEAVRKPEPVVRTITPGPPPGPGVRPGASGGYQGRPVEWVTPGEPANESPAETPTPEPGG